MNLEEWDQKSNGIRKWHRKLKNVGFHHLTGQTAERWLAWFPFKNTWLEPEAIQNASYNLFHSSHTVSICVCVSLPSSAVAATYETADSPDAAGGCDLDADGSCAARPRPAALPALLLGGLFQCALGSGGALEPLGGDGGLVGHALPDDVSFPPQRDLLQIHNRRINAPESLQAAAQDDDE